MPEVQAFPAVGQRDYYAKLEQELNRAGNDQASEPATRKQGFFERLTGRRIKPSDSFENAKTGSQHTVTESHPQNDLQTQGDRRGASRSPQSNKENRGEDPDLPVFFKGRQERG